MFKTFFFLTILLPIDCFAQFTISGKVLNQADKNPVANATIFLSNATIGDKTTTDGNFTLHNVKPGKYDLVVSDIAFKIYNQTVIVESNNIVLPDITLSPKTIALKEVTIKFHADPNKEKYFSWFKDEFLGTSEVAKECKILNPDVLDLSYDETSKTLKASSYDYLEIENDALGYKIKYLITNFSFENKDENEKKIFYKGPVLFEELKGNAADERRWKKCRQDVYENSSMHFLRSALNGMVDEEGFRAQKLIRYANPARQSDSLIENRIKYYKSIQSPNADQSDSLSYWVKKSKLPKTFQKLQTSPLSKQDLIQPTDQPGKYALNCNYEGLLVAYSKSHHFHLSDHLDYLYNPGNKENTLIKFNSSSVFFYNNGVISDPYSVMYFGVWGRNRVAELLPIDYEAPPAVTVR